MDPEERKAKRRAHYLANRERYLERAREWAAKNPEVGKKARQKYAERTKEARREWFTSVYWPVYWSKNKDRIRAARQAKRRSQKPPLP